MKITVFLNVQQFYYLRKLCASLQMQESVGRTFLSLSFRMNKNRKEHCLDWLRCNVANAKHRPWHGGKEREIGKSTWLRKNEDKVCGICESGGGEGGGSIRAPLQEWHTQLEADNHTIYALRCIVSCHLKQYKIYIFMFVGSTMKREGKSGRAESEGLGAGDTESSTLS